MNTKCIQLMAILNQISVRGDDVERMCKAKMLLREVVAELSQTRNNPQPERKELSQNE